MNGSWSVQHRGEGLEEEEEQEGKEVRGHGVMEFEAEVMLLHAKVR